VSFDGTANINLAGVNTTGNQDTTGNAATATKLATARTIGGTSFDGSANIAVALASTATTLANARTINGVSFDGSANITTLTAGTGVSVSGTAVSIGQAVATSNSPTFQNLTLSGTESIKVPAGTTAQRPSGAAGDFRFNTTLGKFEGHDGTEFAEIAGGGASAMETNTFTGDGSTRAFTISSTVSNEDDLIIFIDGVYQNKADFVASGTTVTLDTAPVSGRKIVINHIKANISGSSVTQNAFTGDGSTVAFTLSISPTNENNTQIYIDGVYQHKSTYTVSGTTLTFDTAPVNSTAIDVIMFSQTALNTPASDTVTTSTIADANVTSAKLASNSVTTVKITDANVTTAKLADNAVTTAKITDANVTTAKIADSAITSAKISDGTIATADIADDAVTSAKLDTNIDIAGTLDVTGATTLDSTLSVSGNITGTLATAAQPNITSVGTLTSFRSTGIDDNADALAITIDSSERVGIGTASPSSELHVKSSGTSSDTLTIENSTGNGSWRVKEGGSSNALFQGYNASNSETIRLDPTSDTYFNNGNFGIGTNSPNAYSNVTTLTINGTNQGRVDLEYGGTLGLSLLAVSGESQIKASGSSNVMTFEVNDAERMRIDTSGNLYVGTTSASDYYTQKLMVAGNIAFGTSTSKNLLGDFGETNLYLINYNTDSSATMRFHVGGGASNKERMRIDSSGNLLVGATSRTGGKIFGNATPSTPFIETQNSTTGATHFSLFHRNSAGTEIGFIKVSNTGTTYDTGSDYRLKENIEPIQNGLERLNELKPVKFNWKADGTLSEGFIAHEVQEIFPDAVAGEKDSEMMQGMDYGRITPLLVKAIQEQQEQIETLKAEVKELKENG